MGISPTWHAKHTAALAPAVAAGYGIEIYFTGSSLVGRVQPKQPDMEIWIASPACNLELAGEEHWTVALVLPDEGGAPVESREFDDPADIATHVVALLDIAEDPNRHTYLPSVDVSESCEVCGHSRHHAWHLPYN